MHEDEPADLVHDLLLEALYPDHPLGPRRARHRGHDQRDDARRDRRVLRRALRAGQHRRWPRPAPSTTTRLVGGIADRLSPPPVATRSRVSARRRAGRPARIVMRGRPSRRTSSSACARSTTRPRSLRARRRSTTSSAAACRAGCSRRSARSAGWRTRCTRTGRRSPTPARSRCTPAPRPTGPTEVLKLVARRARPHGRRRRHRRRARRRPRGHLLGSTALGLEDSAARMGRIGRSLLVHDDVSTNAEVERTRIAAVDVATTCERVIRARARAGDAAYGRGHRTLRSRRPVDQLQLAS